MTGVDEVELVDEPADQPAGDGDSDSDAVTNPWLARVGAVRRRVEAEPAAVVLAAAIALFAWVFGLLVWRRHDRFATFDFDLGHHDQAIWLLAHGKGFITVSGMPVLGHHATLAYYALVPFYWLGAGPQFLDLAQTSALGLAAVPVYLLAKHKLGNSWQALVPAVAWLLNPSVQYILWETWHPETVAIPFLLAAYYCASRRRWGPYWFFLIFALAWKEDVALAVAVLGLVFIVRRERRVGLATLAVGVAWFVFAYGLLLPHFNGGKNQAGIFYGDLGTSPSEIVQTAIEHPSKITDRLQQDHAEQYARDLLVPFGVLPLGAPSVLAIGIPQFLANDLAIPDFFWNIRYHYVALILVALMLATVETLAKFRRPGLRRAALGVLGACALATSSAWGLSPLGTRYRSGYWPLLGNARQAEMDYAVTIPPPNASVSATYTFVPHLTHRKLIYTFPNPWIRSNWGVNGVAPRDPDSPHTPDEVQWLVVDHNLLGAPDSQVSQLFTRLTTDGEFTIVYDSRGITVAKRVSGGRLA